MVLAIFVTLFKETLYMFKNAKLTKNQLQRLLVTYFCDYR